MPDASTQALASSAQESASNRHRTLAARIVTATSGRFGSRSNQTSDRAEGERNRKHREQDLVYFHEQYEIERGQQSSRCAAEGRYEIQLPGVASRSCTIRHEQAYGI